MTRASVDAALALPRTQVGEALLALPESQWFDRKSARERAKDLADTEIAFANAEGGVVVVGLHGGAVEGLGPEAAQRENDIRQAAADFTVPPVHAAVSIVPCVNRHGERDHLAVVDIAPSPGVHVNQRDECLLRIGDEDRRLTFHQRQELLYDKGQAQFDATPVPGVEVADLNPRILRRLARAIGHPNQQRVLNARNLLTSSGDLTAAAVLLFDPEPQRRYPEAYVRVLRYRGTERGTGARLQVVKDVDCIGPIPDVIDAAVRAIRRVQPTRRALAASGRFEPQALIPEPAWLEGLVNAVVHRSYSMGGDHIRVEVFDDRIEIESPGRFPGVVNVDDPRSLARFARNPRIARVRKDLAFGQELGEGIRRMYAEMRAAGLIDPLYVQTAASVRLTLSATAGDPGLLDALPSRSREVVELIRNAGGLSTGDVAEALGLAKPATLRRLQALRDAGLIEWVGHSKKDPRAFWRLASE